MIAKLNNILCLHFRIPSGQFVLIFLINFLLVVVQSQDQNSNSLSGAPENETTTKWEAPARVRKLFPYYVSGFDAEGRPIITLNFGAWDIRTFLEEGGPNSEILDKYLQQLVDQMHDSPMTFEKSREAEINQFMIVANMGGYDLRQFSHVPSVQKMLLFCRQFFRAERQEARLYKAIGVNANFFFQTAFSLARPILGHLGSLFEVYGTNSDVWKPIVFRQASRSQLPEFLGGFSNHTHVHTWG